MSTKHRITFTRRRFLTRGAMAASGVALPCFLPASALGRDGAVAPSERIVMGGIGMGGRGSIAFQYDGPDATMRTRLSSGVNLVLFRVAGSVWEPCQYWHGACGERFEGPEGWAAAADGYSGPEVSSPALLREYQKVLADYTSRTQRQLNHARDFFDCIRSRRLTVANPDVMHRSMNICLAADICEQLKRNLKFDLIKADFVGDPEASRLRSRAMRAPYLY